MSKKYILFALGFAFFSVGNVVQAEVSINEIMYAPTNGSNYEWVEIYNSGPEAVDLTGWRFFHGETTSGPLTLRNGSSMSLGVGEYAIIAKSPSVVDSYSFLNFSGMILSASTLSLPDSGDNTYIAISSDSNKTISNSVVYDPSLGGSKESGNSLSKINGSWTNGTPSPGAANQAASSGGTTTNTNTSSSNNESSSSSSTSSSASSAENNSGSSSSSAATAKATSPGKTKVQITTKTLAYTGIPHSFKGAAFGPKGEQLYHGKYYWNFGDGDSREVQVISDDKFTHTYFYPGEYKVLFEYYPDSFTDTPDAFEQVMIRVVTPGVSISSVGGIEDFFVELSNTNDYDVDISNWVLTSDKNGFTFPSHTIIGAKKKIIVSSRLTHFSTSDASTLKLMTREGNIISNYSPFVPLPTPRKSVTNSVNTSNQSFAAKEKIYTTNTEDNPFENLPLGLDAASSQSASVISSGLDEANSSKSYVPVFAFLLIGAAAGTVYFIRQRKPVSSSQTDGSDFAILDE